MATAEKLKAKSIELFGESLGAVVAKEIDRDGSSAKAGSPAGAPSLTAQLFADGFYSQLAVGSFSGRLSVTWDGMDEFIFLPDAENPLTFVRSDGTRIIPQKMYTDGGSIPRLLRGAKKFSSWGYAPAFIVHDWLYTAKKCGYATDSHWQFSDTALIMAEAIKTLMEVGYVNYRGETRKLERAEDTLYLMYLAVRSPIAKALWDDDQSVICVI